MSSATILCAMAASASLTLGLVHLMAWSQNRDKTERLFFVVMTFATAAMTFFELGLMKAGSPEEFGTLLRWYHV
ncbi:MAG: hypothetical protein EOP87_19995, partial [Verrucomicrobiaceae bacterium]